MSRVVITVSIRVMEVIAVMEVMEVMAVTEATTVITATIVTIVIIAIQAIAVTAVIVAIPVTIVILTIITMVITIIISIISIISIMLHINLAVMPLMIGSSELFIVAAIVLLLFGGKKIPELMRSMGQGVRYFKKGMNEEVPEDKLASSNENEGVTCKSVCLSEH